MKRAILVPLLLFLFGMRSLFAQATQPLVINELCTCMSTVDMTNDDHGFVMDVRQCMEDAIVAHPGEVLAMLRRYPDRTDKAYLLGLLLGGALDGSCDRFHAVKARLQNMPGQGSLFRPGS